MTGEVEIASRYNFDDSGLVDALDCSDSPSMTKQEFRQECDINHIMSRYTATGVAPGVSGAPSYGDFSAISDFHTCQNALKHAEARFMELPAKVRDRFDNDPGKFLAYVQGPEVDAKMAEDRLVELGLAVRRPEPPARGPGAAAVEPVAAPPARGPGAAAVEPVAAPPAK